MKPVYVTLLGALLIAATACGGGSGDGSSAAGQGPSPTPAPGGGSIATGSSGTGASTGSAATGSAGGGGSAVTPDACDLLTDADVTAAMGEAVVATRPETQGPTSVCTWDGVTTGRRYVAVIARPAQFAAQVLENSYKNLAGQPIDAGDEGYAITGVNTPDYRYLTAAAIEGDVYIQVNIAGPERPDSEAFTVVSETLRAALEAAR
jgi:hypothetical protein